MYGVVSLSNRAACLANSLACSFVGQYENHIDVMGRDIVRLQTHTSTLEGWFCIYCCSLKCLSMAICMVTLLFASAY